MKMSKVVEGRKVLYTDKKKGKKEEGVITSFNDKYVFVDFGTKHSQAVKPEQIEYLIGR